LIDQLDTDRVPRTSKELQAGVNKRLGCDVDLDSILTYLEILIETNVVYGCWSDGSIKYNLVDKDKS
jgi:hypothetical protein